METLQELFSGLDKEARKIATLKNLFADLLMRDMPDVDKLRLAKCFVRETDSNLLEMSCLIDRYREKMSKEAKE